MLFAIALGIGEKLTFLLESFPSSVDPNLLSKGSNLQGSFCWLKSRQLAYREFGQTNSLLTRFC